MFTNLPQEADDHTLPGKFATGDEQAADASWVHQVHVACRELFGCAAANLICGQNESKKDNAKPQTFWDPIANENFEPSALEPGTWNSKLGPIAQIYEECRADTCALYLQSF